MKIQLKQVAIIITVLLTILLLFACGNSDEPSNADHEMPADEEAASEDELHPREPLTTEALLADFDTMIELMEETFPYFGVAERRLGVDIRALAEEKRSVIENYPESMESFAKELGMSPEEMPVMDEHLFWSILHHDFFSRFPMTFHTFVYNYRFYDIYKPSYTNTWSPFNTPMNYHAFTNSVTQGFYREQEALYKTLAEEASPGFKLIFREEESAGFPHAAVETEMIEEGRIAYLSVPHFADFGQSTINRLRGLYRDIGEYEHLIIDIRENMGGATDLWRMLIMKPLWPEEEPMPDMPLYAFYRGSELGKSLGEANVKIESAYSRYRPESEGLVPISEILEENPLPELNEEDMETLDYGVRYHTGIENIEWRHINQMGLQNISDSAFEGEIWLLIGNRNYSAAALFARHAKEMGFATLVGEPTAGAYTTHVSNFTLPNTGIILRWDMDYVTDEAGRALNEFPTTPHYKNRPGMDALETVLEIIEEEGNTR